MFKITITILLLSLLSLVAQDFLQGVRAEDLMLDKIETPSVDDTVGISDWSRYFYNIQKAPVSPDGKNMAVVKTKEGYANGIWVTNHLSREETQIDQYGMLPQWSQNGQLIAYIRHEPIPGTYDARGHQLYGGDELFICNPSGTNKINMTPGIPCSHFLWSSDNQHIVFSYWGSTKGADGQFTIAVVDITTSQIRKIDNGSPYNDIGFTLSPNGKMLAYCKPLKWELKTEWWVTEAEVFIYNIDGTGKTQITDTEAVETMVKWSDDGKYLIVQQVGLDPCDLSITPYVRLCLKKK